MNNKKNYGFTLAEILGVIVIVGLLLVIAGPLIIARIRGNKNTAGEIGDKIIFEAVSQYDDENPDTNHSDKRCISIKSLIDGGKLISPVVDVKTGEEIDDKSVLITRYKSGYREFKILSNADCSQEEVIPVVPREPEIKIIDTDENCSDGYIRLKFIDKSGTGIASYSVSFSEVNDSDVIWNDLGGKTSVNYTPPFDAEKIFIYVKDKAGNVGKKNYRFNTRHTITFDPNGGTVDPTSKTVYKFKMYGELPIAKKGSNSLGAYTFDGWYTAKEGGRKITSDNMACSDQTLYAHYTSKYFQIRSYMDCNKLLDLNHGNAVNGEKIQLWEYSNSNAQRWHIQENSDGSVTFRSNVNRNYCLDVPHGDVIGNYKNNTPLELYDCNNSDAQKFIIDSSNSDYFVIKTKKNSRYCIDVPNASTANGNGLILWECNGGFNQRWFLKDSCDSNVKAPTCSIELSGVRGEDNWFRSNVNVSLKTGNTVLDSYGLSTSSRTVNSTNSLTHYSDTYGTTYYGIARNKSGNVECSVVVKKDTASPEISYGYLDNARFESIPYGRGRYFNFYYRDNLSGLINSEVPFEAFSFLEESYHGSPICISGWKPAGGTLCSDSQNNRANYYYRGYRVKDKAGNVSNIVCSYLSNGGSYSQSGPSNPCNANGIIFRND